jgi:mitogen-activated protein kinase 1/3/mitogen-activated protein kinase 6
MVEPLHPPKAKRPLGPFSNSLTEGPSSLNSRTIKVLGSTFQLDQRYDILDTVGSGAYGVVVSARDTRTGEMVAIKKIEKAFEHPTFTKRTLRELKILRLMQHENIIGIKAIQLPRTREEMDEIYVVNELMETDLSSVIRSPQPLEDEHCQFFIYQILRGLKYLHSASVLHRDLKPRNLLVNGSCDLKICDFGLARADLPNLKVRAASMTDYVATRWYRAPEVLLTYKIYTKALDIWSVGCILGELLLRMPLLPGNDATHQLELIFSLIGTPSAEEIAAIPNPNSREKLLRLPKKFPSTIDARFASCNPLAVDLMKQMLVFDPKKRVPVETALEHPYLEQFREADDEPLTHPVSLFDFEFEREVLTMRELKDMIYEEILLYHFPSKLDEYERAKRSYSTSAAPPNSVMVDEQGEDSDDELT